MRPFFLACLALCLLLPGTAAFARGATGSHMSMGGALGTSAARPGTNSLGTALPSSGTAGQAMQGPLLGTNPAVNKEDAQVERMVEGSICRGC
ncbi:hypothetical protein EAV90_34090 [Bradyrhizobium vignae]|nr:hypothetical protein EAV90_34090 [Bradyrhizobium vignae]